MAATKVSQRAPNNGGSRKLVRYPLGCAMAAASVLTACRPSDVLSVPPPAGVTAASAYNSQTGAEALFANGKGALANAIAAGFGGLLQWTGLLGDEFSIVAYDFIGTDANIDARRTTGGGGYGEPGDRTLQSLMAARVTLLTALPLLKKYEPATGRSKIGEAYALNGYIELLAAEDYCSGLPLGQLVAGVGPQYGSPLTTDSLLGVAETDFDSAAANAGGSDTVQALASIGLARALLNRGQFAAAASAVASVSTTFVYNTELVPGFYSPAGNNLYDTEAAYFGCGLVTVGDFKGTNGLNYISAQDPRMPVSDTIAESCDAFTAYGALDSVWYYPLKFPIPSAFIPLASGVEARLIQAEAALQSNDVATWSTDLNALRADSTDTHVDGLLPLTTDSTLTASTPEQVQVMFRERGFWLYGEGYRLGDMRRMIRQYGLDQSTVFPVGPYPQATNPQLPSPLPSYGTDVNLTLPTFGGTVSDPNPAYKGCLTSTKVA